jgi:hypothetical protein
MRAPFVLLLVAGCASVPSEELVWSSALAQNLRVQFGDSVEVASFSRLRPGAVTPPWEPYLVLRGNTPTRYELVELEGSVALAAQAEAGGSGLYRKIRIDPRRHPLIEFRWRVPAREAGESALELAARASPLMRLSLAFHGDPAKLDFDDRTKLRLAKALTVNGLPYASLLYVWKLADPAETVLRSPHTDRVRYIVAVSGAKRIGEWVAIRRNVLEDYRRAFGEEPGDIVAVGLMTDPGDDGSSRRAYYGDITFRSAK